MGNIVKERRGFISNCRKIEDKIKNSVDKAYAVGYAIIQLYNVMP